MDCFNLCTNTGEFLFSEAVDELWIGLNDLNTQMYFEWSDGTPMTYTRQLPGEPTHETNGQQDCVIMARQVESLHVCVALHYLFFVAFFFVGFLFCFVVFSISKCFVFLSMQLRNRSGNGIFIHSEIQLFKIKFKLKLEITR